MNATPNNKRSWWQIIVFVEEAYLALTGFVFFILAGGRIDTDGPTAAFMGLSYLAVIVALLISGVLLSFWPETSVLKTVWCLEGSGEAESG
jgi:hypothetical protein